MPILQLNALGEVVENNGEGKITSASRVQDDNLLKLSVIENPMVIVDREANEIADLLVTRDTMQNRSKIVKKLAKVLCDIRNLQETQYDLKKKLVNVQGMKHSLPYLMSEEEKIKQAPMSGVSGTGLEGFEEVMGDHPIAQVFGSAMQLGFGATPYEGVYDMPFNELTALQEHQKIYSGAFAAFEDALRRTWPGAWTECINSNLRYLPVWSGQRYEQWSFIEMEMGIDKNGVAFTPFRFAYPYIWPSLRAQFPARNISPDTNEVLNRWPRVRQEPPPPVEYVTG